MTWYLGVTATGLMRPYPDADRQRGEFAVQQQLTDMGIECWAGRRTEFLRRGKNRYAEAIVSPYLRGYIFANIPEYLFHTAIQSKGLRPTLMAITSREMDDQIKPFMARVDAEDAEAQAIAARNDIAEMTQYEPGERISILSGPFADRVATFCRMVHGPDFPLLEFETTLMGRSVYTRIDPLQVAKG